MQYDPVRAAIALGDAEHREPLILATTGAGHTTDDSAYLHREVDRARVAADAIRSVTPLASQQ